MALGMTGNQPVLYSFRRCPYAMRARWALLAAGLLVELREVQLKRKPQAMLEASAKGTVPVLVCPDGTVIEESLEVMRWALDQADPQGWLTLGDATALIEQNDGPFKHHLDRFKYSDRYPGEDPGVHQRAGRQILEDWNDRVARQGWLLGPRQSLADAALWPFVRQWRVANPQVFDADQALAPLREWLSRYLDDAAMPRLMLRANPWQPGDPSLVFPADAAPVSQDQPLFHIALEADWQAAQATGFYSISTLGLTLEQVGFIHLSWKQQLIGTFERFYADAGPVRVLEIDPSRLTAPLRADAIPTGDQFPHLYGPLPLTAVLDVHVDPYKV